MVKLFINVVIGILMSFFLFGCSATKSKLDIESYKIVQARLDFVKNQNPTMTLEIDKDTNQCRTILLDGHIKIMYKIDLNEKNNDRIKSILHIDLYANNRVKFHKLLIDKKDYFFDSVNNAVYLVVNIPYIYLLDKKLKLKTSISMINRRRELVTRNINMFFEIGPMRDSGEKYMSFKYENSFNSENLDPHIVKTIEAEFTKINKAHFSKAYIKRHSKFFNGD